MAQPLFSHHASIFRVPDIGEALLFYRDKLGFSVEFLWEEPPSYAVLQRDNAVQLHLSRAEPGTAGGGLAYVFVRDVDEVFQEYQAKGLNLPPAPIDADYGMRDFEVTDPWGNRITLGQG